MIAYKSRLAQLVFAAIVLVCMISVSPAAPATESATGYRPPAGQMCPKGAHVIGFDTDANIICSEVGESGVLYPLEAPAEGNAEIGDDCQAKCQSGEVDSRGTTEAIAVEPVPAQPSNSLAIPGPVITDVKPSSALYGAAEVTLTVIGEGFGAESVILFAGSRYSPSVNPTGTRLEVTVPTRDLSMGRYGITVSNGPGKETSLKRALEIY